MRFFLFLFSNKLSINKRFPTHFLRTLLKFRTVCKIRLYDVYLHDSGVAGRLYVAFYFYYTLAFCGRVETLIFFQFYFARIYTHVSENKRPTSTSNKWFLSH